ncbi:MAG: RNA polymerase sporulation sigma factor SigK [Clostridia bacterium]|nr:RNA polymerase sporulation sigma factor SigK [Clostridia bacterium]
MFASIISLISNFLHLILGIGTPGKYPPPLSSEKEREYFTLLKTKKDEAAREALILHNLRLVSHIVRKYYASSPNQEDLVSIGTVGLIKAVDSFSDTNGARFATYASRCIQNEILMHFRSQKKLAQEVSLSETIDVDRDGNPLTYIDVICSEDNVADDVEIKIRTQKMMRLLKTALTTRERRIITMRYGLGESKPLTQRETAERLGISRSYVSRLEKSAISKLRGEFDK